MDLEVEIGPNSDDDFDLGDFDIQEFLPAEVLEQTEKIMYQAGKEMEMQQPTEYLESPETPEILKPEIKFFNPRGQNGFLSPFFRAPFNFGNVTYQTVEHFFQSQKFPNNPALQLEIINASSPDQAQKIAQEHNQERLPNWDDVKIDAYRHATYLKFMQNPELQKRLLDTKDGILIYESKNSFWGTGIKGGRNWYGRILMDLRDQFEDETEEIKSISSPEISPETQEKICYSDEYLQSKKKWLFDHLDDLIRLVIIFRLYLSQPRVKTVSLDNVIREITVDNLLRDFYGCSELVKMTNLETGNISLLKIPSRTQVNDAFKGMPSDKIRQKLNFLQTRNINLSQAILEDYLKQNDPEQIVNQISKYLNISTIDDFDEIEKIVKSDEGDDKEKSVVPPEISSKQLYRLLLSRGVDLGKFALFEKYLKRNTPTQIINRLKLDLDFDLESRNSFQLNNFLNRQNIQLFDLVDLIPEQNVSSEQLTRIIIESFNQAQQNQFARFVHPRISKSIEEKVQFHGFEIERLALIKIIFYLRFMSERFDQIAQTNFDENQQCYMLKDFEMARTEIKKNLDKLECPSNNLEELGNCFMNGTLKIAQKLREFRPSSLLSRRKILTGAMMILPSILPSDVLRAPLTREEIEGNKRILEQIRFVVNDPTLSIKELTDDLAKIVGNISRSQELILDLRKKILKLRGLNKADVNSLIIRIDKILDQIQNPKKFEVNSGLLKSKVDELKYLFFEKPVKRKPKPDAFKPKTKIRPKKDWKQIQAPEEEVSKAANLPIIGTPAKQVQVLSTEEILAGFQRMAGKAPQISQVPQVPQAPQISQVPQAPQAPQSPKTPESSPEPLPAKYENLLDKNLNDLKMEVNDEGKTKYIEIEETEESVEEIITEIENITNDLLDEIKRVRTGVESRRVRKVGKTLKIKKNLDKIGNVIGTITESNVAEIKKRINQIINSEYVEQQNLLKALTFNLDDSPTMQIIKNMLQREQNIIDSEFTSWEQVAEMDNQDWKVDVLDLQQRINDYGEFSADRGQRGVLSLILILDELEKLHDGELKSQILKRAKFFGGE